MQNIKKYISLYCLCGLFVLFSSLGAQAVQPDEILANPQLEQRARDLSAQLRCLVCRNETIDDSNAPLARDLRLLVRDRLQKGDTNQQVLDFIVARYGEYVLLKPPFWSSALFLWLFPGIVLLLAIVYLYYSLHQRRKNKTQNFASKPLTKEEKAKIKAILSDISKDKF